MENVEDEELGYNEKNCGIYCITNLTNSKVYIGQSINIPKRMQDHLFKAFGIGQCSRHLYNAMRKYGIDNFEWDILELCKREELSIREAYYIKKFKATNRLNGYNSSDYDEKGNIKLSDETKTKIGDALRGVPKSQEHINNMYTKFSKDNLPNREAIDKRVETVKEKYKNGYVSPMLGKTSWNKGILSSDETKEKQRLAKLGTKLSQKHKNAIRLALTNRVCQFNMEGIFIQWWDSAIEINKSDSSFLLPGIRGCCNGTKPYYLKSIFRYEKDIEDIENPQLNELEFKGIQKRYNNSKNRTSRGSYNSHNRTVHPEIKFKLKI